MGLLAVLAAACREEPAREAPPPAVAAAVVGGRRIPVEWVEAIAGREGVAPREALDRAVETAALGALARARGVDRESDTLAAIRSMLVRLMLRREVEIGNPDEWTERDRADIERLYRERITYFEHPEVRTAVHLAVVLDPDPHRRARGPRIERTEAEWAAGRAATEEMLPLVMDAASDQAVLEMRPIFEARVREAWKDAGLSGAGIPRVAAERIGPADREAPYDPAFLDAVFSMEGPGDVVGPVRTAFGYHIIYLARIDPPRATPPPEAMVEAAERGALMIERDRLDALLRAAYERRGIVSRPERLRLTMPERAGGGP